jgi:long-chain fatty acid transport protein
VKRRAPVVRTHLVCLALAGPALAAQAAGFATTDKSAAAMGVAGSATARAEDPGVAAYNPAAALMQPGLHFAAGTLLAAPSLSASGAGVEASTDGGVSTPPHVFARWSGEAWGAGLSATVPFGSQVAWPADWARRFDVVEARLSVLRLAAHAGWHDERWALAGGAFVDVGTLELGRALDFVEVEGSAAIETHAVGVGVQLGAYGRVLDTLDVGLAYTSRSRLALSGWADFTTPPELRGRAQDSEVTAELVLPDRLALGLLWRPAEGWDVSLDLELYLWSTVDELVLDFAVASMSDSVQPRAWSATLAPRAGVTWAALEWLRLRGGLLVDPSPVPASTLGPTSPDSLRVGLALGAGVALGAHVSLDVGYQLLVFTGQTSALEASAGVRFGGVAHVAGASVALAWGD